MALDRKHPLKVSGRRINPKCLWCGVVIYSTDRRFLRKFCCDQHKKTFFHYLKGGKIKQQQARKQNKTPPVELTLEKSTMPIHPLFVALGDNANQ